MKIKADTRYEALFLVDLASREGGVLFIICPNIGIRKFVYKSSNLGHGTGKAIIAHEVKLVPGA